jgi:hypothetical protein
MGEGISAGYEALVILVRSALGMGRKKQDLRASAISEGVGAMLWVVTMLGMVGEIEGDGFILLLILPKARCLFFI